MTAHFRPYIYLQKVLIHEPTVQITNMVLHVYKSNLSERKTSTQYLLTGDFTEFRNILIRQKYFWEILL